MTRTGPEAERWKNTEGLRCPKCRSIRLHKDGYTHGKQRYRCKRCGTVTIAPGGVPRGGIGTPLNVIKTPID